jgi:hypothetical protein
MGVRFTNAYVQSPICGASRMSFYTGRYASSHGAQWNGFPLRVGEHDARRSPAQARHGLLADRQDPHEGRRGGHGPARPEPRTASSARARPNAASTSGSATTASGARGRTVSTTRSARPTTNTSNRRAMTATTPGPTSPMPASRTATCLGWMFMNADKPANIREEDSETPWLTSRTIEFIDQAKGTLVHPCQLHQAALALYRARALPRHVRPEPCPGGPPSRRSASDPHPVYGAFMATRSPRPSSGRGPREGDPGLYGADQAMRRPAWPVARPSGSDRAGWRTR